MEMEPDIDNMMMNEYLENRAENIKRIGQDIVQDNIWKQDDDLEEDQEDNGNDRDTFDIWDITVKDVERIRQDEILNVTMVDEGAKCNPAEDLEKLERLLVKEPQSKFTEIQKPSRDFTRPLRLLSGLKGLLHTPNATVIPTKHTKLILGYRDACEIRISLIPC
nr:hypothetical protein [Tanacetum cinerariifolium]